MGDGVVLPEGTGHREATARLEAAGWTLAARGDWAWVFRSPSGRLAARVCPFDPAYAIHVALCLRHASNPYFQRIERVSRVGAHGQAVVMEWLGPADEQRAAALCAALRPGSDSQPEAARAWASTAAALDHGLDPATDPALDEARRVLAEAAAEAARRVPYWGGLDIRPGNVMQDAQGQLKIVDPFFVAGRRLFAAILDDLPAVLARLPLDAVECFLQIAAIAGGEADGEAGGEVARARALVAEAARTAVRGSA